MAYTFNRLAGALGEGEDKANIFGQGQQQQGGGGGGAAGGQGFALTGGGEAAGAGGPKVADTGEGEAKQSMALQSGGEQAQIAKLNQPSEQAQSNVYQGVGEAINQKKGELAKEARDYTRSADQSTSGGFYGDRDKTTGNVQSAIQSGDQGFGNLQTFLSGGAAPQLADYTSNVTTGVEIPKTQAELSGHLQRTSNRPTYSGGQAALDAALLRNSQPFQQEQQQLQTAQEGLEGQQYRQALTAEEQQAQAQREYEEQIGMIQGDILPQLQLDLLGEQQAEIEAAQNYTPDEIELRRAFDEASQEYVPGDSGAFDYGQYSDVVDPSSFYSREVSDDPLAYLDEGEQSYYNQLATLMNDQPLGELPGGPTGSFDIGGYYDQLAQAQMDAEVEAAQQEENIHGAGNVPMPEGVGSSGAGAAGSLAIDPNAEALPQGFSGARIPQASTDIAYTPGSLMIDEEAAAAGGPTTINNGNFNRQGLTPLNWGRDRSR